jgi:hypothetical protein
MQAYENGFRADIVYGNKSMEKVTDWRKDLDPWTVTLKYKRRQMTFEFWTSETIGKPSLGMILESLISTASDIDRNDSFDSWCHELGYDTDSRQAYETYKVSCKLAFKFKKLVREDYEKIVKLYERWEG